MINAPVTETVQNDLSINSTNPTPKTVQSISLDSLVPEEDQNVQINISPSNMLDDFEEDFAPSEVPIEASSEIVGETFASAEDERNSMIALENDSSNDFTKEDFDDIADFLIDGISFGGSYLLGWYAMDSKPENYELKNDKMKKLKKQLSKVLLRMNAKFSFTMIFFVTLILIYSKNFSDAHKHRKEAKSKQAGTDKALKMVKKAELKYEAPKGVPLAKEVIPVVIPQPQEPAKEVKIVQMEQVETPKEVVPSSFTIPVDLGTVTKKPKLRKRKPAEKFQENSVSLTEDVEPTTIEPAIVQPNIVEPELIPFDGKVQINMMDL